MTYNITSFLIYVRSFFCMIKRIRFCKYFAEKDIYIIYYHKFF